MMKAHTEKGFTLVEVLVAVTVTALLLTAVYQTVSTASFAREKLAVENARHHMARIVTERIGRELQSLRFDPADDRTRFTGGLSGRDPELLSFTSTASTPLSKQPGLPARISYRLEADPDAGDRPTYTLNRVETSILAEDEGRAYKLAGGLQSLTVRFLDDGRWVDRWNSASAGSLPAAVELTITSGTEASETVFRTVWPLEET